MAEAIGEILRVPTSEVPAVVDGIGGEAITPLAIYNNYSSHMPLTYSAQNLHPGLTVNPATGEISGTPTAGASLVDEREVSLVATDSNGLSTARAFPLRVINKGAEAKAWFDMNATTLKTDLVRNFTSASGQYLKINSADLTDIDTASTITLAMWVKLTTPGWSQLAGFYTNASSNRWGIIINSSGYPYLYITDSGGLKTAGSSVLLAGAWTLVTALITPAQSKLFLNTTQRAVVTHGSPLATSNAFAVGGYSSGGGYFDGQVGHMAAWGGDKTASLTDLYNDGTPSLAAFQALTADRISLWTMTEPRGAGYDLDGNNNLTAINNPVAAHGPAEELAQDYAGITARDNQGLAPNPFGRLELERAVSLAVFAPQLINGELVLVGDTASFEEIVTLPQPFTVVSVVDPDNLTGTKYLWDTSATTRHSVWINNVDLYLRASGGSDTDTGLNASGGKQVVIAEFNGASSKISLDDDEALFDGGSGDAVNFCELGDYNSGNTVEFNGKSYAFLVFPRVLTAAEKAALKARFA